MWRAQVLILMRLAHTQHHRAQVLELCRDFSARHAARQESVVISSNETTANDIPEELEYIMPVGDQTQVSSLAGMQRWHDKLDEFLNTEGGQLIIAGALC